MRVPPPLVAPLSLLVWISIILVVIIWTPLMLLGRLFTFRGDPDRYRIGRLFRDSAVTATRLNPFWRFRVIDDVHPDPRRPYVVVSNHLSFADVFLLSHFPWEMKYLSKRSITRIPLLGWQMRMAGDVELLRGDKESARVAMAELRERLDRKLSVLMFPEGTRGRDGRLGPFRDGAFRLAVEASVDVLPVVIWGTERALPKHSVKFGPTEALARVLPPISTAGMTVEDVPRLTQAARDAIQNALARGPE